MGQSILFIFFIVFISVLSFLHLVDEQKLQLHSDSFRIGIRIFISTAQSVLIIFIYKFCVTAQNGNSGTDKKQYFRHNEFCTFNLTRQKRISIDKQAYSNFGEHISSDKLFY